MSDEREPIEPPEPPPNPEPPYEGVSMPQGLREKEFKDLPSGLQNRIRRTLGGDSD